MKLFSKFSPRRSRRAALFLAASVMLVPATVTLCHAQGAKPDPRQRRFPIRRLPADPVLGAPGSASAKANVEDSAILPAALAAYEEPYKGKPDKVLTLLTTYLRNTGVDKEIADANVTVLAIPNLAWAHAPTAVFQPGNSEKLKSLLRDHIVKRRYTYDTLLKAISDQGGTVRLQTLSGGFLDARRVSNGILLEGSPNFRSSDPFDADKAGRWPRFRRSSLLIHKGRDVTARRGAGLVIDDFLKPNHSVRID